MNLDFIADRVGNKIRKAGLLRGSMQTLEVFLRPPYRRLLAGPLLNSYSQVGEDRLIDRLLGNSNSGFYLDIGAFDPVLLSNTYRFYRKGWKGITIEPNPSKRESFRKKRPRDTHLPFGLSETGGQLKYYRFTPEYLSTFSDSKAEELARSGFKYDLIDVPVIRTETLKEEYLKDQRIDLLSIDVEGMDLEILKSLDLGRLQPRCICVEVGSHAAEYDSLLLPYHYQRAHLSIHCGNELNGLYLLTR